jgi:hypothetical protein
LRGRPLRDQLALVNEGGPVDGRRTDLSPELDFVPLNAHIAPRVVQLEDHRDRFVRLEAVSSQDEFYFGCPSAHEKGCCQLVLFN